MTEDLMRGIVTVDQLRECSEIIGSDATRDQIEFAKEQFMKYMNSALTPQEHMRLCVDMIATLEIRDYPLFVAMMQAVALHALEQVIERQLGIGGDDAEDSPAQSEEA